MTARPAQAGQLWRGAKAEPVTPGLYLVATPIGNLRDISLRALATLAGCQTVLAEDTRVSRKLLDHYAITTPLSPYHEHNAAQVRPGIIARLQAGAALALISDAGTPLISDPGYKLVTAAIEAGVAVVPIPGASALLAALTVAGLPADRFFFEGFLPPKSAARRARIAAIAAIPGTLIFYESPRRTAEALRDLAAVLGPRQAVIARELTKHFETLRRGTLASLAAELAGEADPKGEIVLLVAPPGAAAAAQPADIDEALREALARLSVKDAAAVVSAQIGAPRREVYARAVALAGRGGER